MPEYISNHLMATANSLNIAIEPIWYAMRSSVNNRHDDDYPVPNLNVPSLSTETINEAANETISQDSLQSQEDNTVTQTEIDYFSGNSLPTRSS